MTIKEDEMKLCINCYYCKVHCQCNYPQWCKKVNYCCEKCEAADSRIAELEAQLTAAQAEITRLREGLTAAIEVIDRYARIDAGHWGASFDKQNEHARGATEHFRAVLNAKAAHSGEADK